MPEVRHRGAARRNCWTRRGKETLFSPLPSLFHSWGNASIPRTCLCCESSVLSQGNETVRENKKGDEELQPALKRCARIGRIKPWIREKKTQLFRSRGCGLITPHQVTGIKQALTGMTAWRVLAKHHATVTPPFQKPPCLGRGAQRHVYRHSHTHRRKAWEGSRCRQKRMSTAPSCPRKGSRNAPARRHPRRSLLSGCCCWGGVGLGLFSLEKAERGP